MGISGGRLSNCSLQGSFLCPLVADVQHANRVISRKGGKNAHENVIW